jgi:nitroimidazol reductase NimA-like FMN-containing flavoprotein (pyridoxamine 5'-phosphate oxidase superfamily)
MLIRDMRREAADALLTRVQVGHIACTEGQQSYVTPFSFGYDRSHIYSIATVGRKITALRANPLVCIAAQEVVSFQEWKSVLVSGCYEELPDTEEFFNARTAAQWLLSEHAAWWEPGYVKTLHDGMERPMESVWFRVSIDSISGHEAVPDTPAPTLESAGFQLGRGLRRRLRAWGWRRRAGGDRALAG